MPVHKFRPFVFIYVDRLKLSELNNNLFFAKTQDQVSVTLIKTTINADTIFRYNYVKKGSDFKESIPTMTEFNYFKSRHNLIAITVVPPVTPESSQTYTRSIHHSP